MRIYTTVLHYMVCELLMEKKWKVFHFCYLLISFKLLFASFCGVNATHSIVSTLFICSRFYLIILMHLWGTFLTRILFLYSIKFDKYLWNCEINVMNNSVPLHHAILKNYWEEAAWNTYKTKWKWMSGDPEIFSNLTEQQQTMKMNFEIMFFLNFTIKWNHPHYWNLSNCIKFAQASMIL